MMSRWRPPLSPSAHPLEEKVRKLESALEDARETIIHLMPLQFSEVLDSYDQCESTSNFHRWREAIAEKIVELVPESSVNETSVSRRVNCPLCQRAALGSFGVRSDGFKLPLGLIRHLTGYGNVQQCGVTKAAFALGRDYVERHYGEAERAAKKIEDEEKARETKARRKSETLHKIHPFNAPELVDEGYRSWLCSNRSSEGLAWAEERIMSLGFQKHFEGNAQSFEKQAADYVIYADVRSQKKITFNVFRLPVTKGKKVWETSFDLPDYFKHDIKDKFETRLKDALERFHRR